MVLGTEDAHMNSQETVPTLKGLNLEGRLHPQGGTKRQSQCRQRVSKALWEAKGSGSSRCTWLCSLFFPEAQQ